MGVLTEKDSSGSVKVVGSDSSGNESNYLGVTTEGEIKVSSFPNLTYSSASKTATTTETLAAVGGSNLPNRKTITIYNQGAQDIFYGPTGVTDTNGGIPIFKDEIQTIDVGDNVDIFLVTKTASATFAIQEFS